MRSHGSKTSAADAFELAMIELGVLTGMILVFVASLLIIRRRVPDAMAARG